MFHVLTKVFCTAPDPEQLADTRDPRRLAKELPAPSAAAWLQHPTRHTPQQSALESLLRHIGLSDAEIATLVPEDTNHG